MKAVDSHLLTLLKKSSQFIVPIYQRVYSWQESECEQLWSDILRAGVTDRMGAHFTGSIVYVARGQSTNTSAEPDLIIDASSESPRSPWYLRRWPSTSTRCPRTSASRGTASRRRRSATATS